MRLRLARQQLCRTLPNTLWMLTPHETTVIQEELQ
jgi:hypothetical protein